MSEDSTKSLDDQPNGELPFEEFVKFQFGLISQRLTGVESEMHGLRGEMVERFLQLSKQIRRLDAKVDVFVVEYTDLKAEVRELREAIKPGS